MSLSFWKKRAPHRSRPTPAPTPAPSPAPLPQSGSVTPVRVTTEQDGTVINRGYSYYPVSFVEPAGTVLTFCGIAGDLPQFFRLELDGSITKLGPLLPYPSESEGWYFDQAGRVYLCDGPRLKRVYPLTGQETTVLDISVTHPGCDLWQAHSSDDGLAHSATVRRIVSDGPYQKIGTVVQSLSGRLFYQAIGVLDESQIDASGEWLIIKENDDNRIINLTDGSERFISNAEGALGHSDCGSGFAVGENDQIGACVYLDLRTLKQRSLFSTWNMGHVSVRGGRCLLSDAETLALVALDGSGLTPLVNHGMVGSGYDYHVHANLDPTGRVAAYVSNAAGRMDLYLVRLWGT